MGVSPVLSILIPLFNEEDTIGALLERVLAAPLADGISREIIVVDDGSSDSSGEIVESFAARHPEIRLHRHPLNRGKGAAVRTALEDARGEFCIIQDADLEYDPREYSRLLEPLVDGSADVVYGSRFMAWGARRVLYFWHTVANRLLTTLCNIVSDLNLSDMGTGYKAFRTSLVRSIPLRNDRFGIEPELTIKLARREARIYETPVSYHGRTYDQGKKIGFKDAVEAVWVIARNAFTRDIYREHGPSILEAFSGAKRFNQWMADTVRPYVGDSVLEIGAGIGNLTRQLSRGRKRYIAADIDEEHLERLRVRFQHSPQIGVSACNLIEPADFAAFSDQMDCVICLNVLEHVPDDQLAMRNIHSALCKGGRAIILVPHDQAIYGTLDEVLGHYRRYTHQQLREVMEAQGLVVREILEFNRISRPAWYLSGRVFKRRTMSPLQLKLFDRTVWFWRFADRLLPWPPTSIIAIGEKK